MRRGEYWLNKVGIGLVLFAVVFLFKYSIDQGWLTPTIRVGFGLALGVALNLVGFRLYSRRRHFSLVMIGGGIATFYITGFAAFQLFELVPFAVAMAFMVAVTVLAFAVSLKQDEVIMSLIGAIGGLATPFLLHTGEGNVPKLIGYTCLLLTGTGAMYFFKGWRVLLWVSVIGGWIVGLIATDFGGIITDIPEGNLWALRGGLLFAWAMFWLMPVAREVARAVSPERWCPTSIGIGDNTFDDVLKSFLSQHVHALTVSTAMVTMAGFLTLWDLSDQETGWILMGSSLVYGMVAWTLHKSGSLGMLSFTHWAVGTMIFTDSIWWLLSGDAQLMALAAEVLVLHLISRRISRQSPAVGAHILSVILGGMLVARLFAEQATGTAIFNQQALADLWVVAVWVACSRFVRPGLERSVYILAAASLLAGVFWRELDGDLLFFAWTVEAVTLHLASRLLKDRNLALAGHIGFALLSAIFVFDRMYFTATGYPVLNRAGLTDLALVAAVVGMASSRIVRPGPERSVYFVAASAILAGLFWRELDGNLLFFVWIVEAVTLQLTARLFKDRNLVVAGHVGFGLLASIFMFDRLLDPAIGSPILNWAGMADLALVLAVVGLPYLLKEYTERVAYRVAAHVLILMLFYREFASLENGQGYVTIAWGVYSIVLLVVGLLRDHNLLRSVALGTLLLVVGKLFLVDLAHLETIWRIVLFFGFGVVFLVISYFFRAMWKSEAEPEPVPEIEKPKGDSADDR